MESIVRNAIARIDVIDAGRNLSRGTGALITPNLVLTAFHVVADRRQDALSLYPGEIQLTFPGHSTKAVLHESYWDRHADWALLRCVTPPPAEPLPLAQLDGSGAKWQTYGFPDAKPQDGMVLAGIIRDDHGELEGMPVF